MNTHDPRHGRPSASAFRRYRNCRSSWQMEQEAKRQAMVPPAGPDAASGTRIARWLETQADDDFAALSHDEQITADIIRSQEVRLIEDWRQGEDLAAQREFRLGMTELGNVISFFGGRPVPPMVYTGQPDLLVIDGRRGLLIDDKAGRLAVPDAAGNEQLMALAPLVASYFDLDTLRVAIVQPLCGEPTVADYSTDDLARAMAHNLALVAEIESAGPDKLTPGDWCHYCPARAICPALRALVTSAPDALDMDSLHGDGKHIRSAAIARALALPAEEHSRLLKGAKMRGWFEAAIKAAGIMRLTRGEDLPGFELRDRAGRRKIEDTEAAANILYPLLTGAEGGPQQALLRSSSLRPRSLQDEIQKASGRKTATRYNLTGEDAKDLLRAALGGLMAQGKTRVLAETGAVLTDEEEEDR